jgi:hypothetical protein
VPPNITESPQPTGKDDSLSLGIKAAIAAGSIGIPSIIAIVAIVAIRSGCWTCSASSSAARSDDNELSEHQASAAEEDEEEEEEEEEGGDDGMDEEEDGERARTICLSHVRNSLARKRIARIL